MSQIVQPLRIFVVIVIDEQIIKYETDTYETVWNDSICSEHGIGYVMLKRGCGVK